MQERKEQQEFKNKEDEDMYRIRKGTFDLLPEADENISKLQVTIMSLYVHCTRIVLLCVHCTYTYTVYMYMYITLYMYMYIY